MSKKFIVIQGLQRSGKTAIAMRMLARHPKSVRISKDDIREMVHKGLTWQDKDEHIVLEAEKLLISLAISDEKTIIIDDTNLNYAHVERYKKLAYRFDYEFEILQTERTAAKCVEEDLKQNTQVGRDNIYNTAFLYGIGDQEREFVIYGLDGTLIDNSERLEFAKMADGSINNSIYYEPVIASFDEIKQNIRQTLLNDFDAGFEIFIISYRPEILRESTEAFLQANGIPWNRLILRQNNDSRPEYKFKKHSIMALTDYRFCLRVVDDNPDVIKICHDLKLGTLDLSNGELCT